MMEPKPTHLGPRYASQFADPSVVAAYACRPPYPPEVVDALVGLLGAGPRVVLEVGCGRGDLTLPLAARVDRVDAVDPSAGMLEEARRRAGKADPVRAVRWIHAGIEDAPLDPPYGLAVAAESLHWTDWDVSLRRLARALAPGGRLALVNRRFGPGPWQAELDEIIPKYSTNQDFAPYDLVEELARRGLFEEEGRTETARRVLVEPVGRYVESFHSRNGFSRDRMAPAAAEEFDRAVAAMVRRHSPDGTVRIVYSAVLVHGRPADPR